MNFVNKLLHLLNQVWSVFRLHQTANTALDIQIDDFIQKHLYQNPKYDAPKRLSRFEHQVFSQGGEDGILEEIFNRIGTTNQRFVEFGVGDGRENNTVYLLCKGWSGLWMEGNPKFVQHIQQNQFASVIANGTLVLKQTFITAENIEALLKEAAIPAEIDLLCIDIDGNDYWVWKAIQSYRPRVVSIEYNAAFTPQVRWIRKYDAQAAWDGTSYHGASLKSLELLGSEKGYKLVGCSFTGVNAFFVREDLVADHFHAPYTAETHYEPPRYYLVRTKGHPRSFGDFVTQ